MSDTPTTVYQRIARAVLIHRAALQEGVPSYQREALIALSNVCLEEAALLPASPTKPRAGGLQVERAAGEAGTPPPTAPQPSLRRRIRTDVAITHIQEQINAGLASVEPAPRKPTHGTRVSTRR